MKILNKTTKVESKQDLIDMLDESIGRCMSDDYIKNHKIVVKIFIDGKETIIYE